VPTPVKKATLSSAAAERLSKPTAASISKVRNPTLLTGGKASAAGSGSLARKGTGAVKPRVGVSPARVKDAASAKAKAKKENGNGAVAVAGSTAAPTTEEEIVLDGPEPELVEPTHGDGEVRVEEPEEIVQEEVEGAIGVDEGGEETVEEEGEGPSIAVSSDLTPHSPEEHEHEPELDPDDELPPTHDTHTNSNPHSPSPSPSQDPDLEETLVEHSTPKVPPSSKATDDADVDMDDIVNILETVPVPVSSVQKVRPVSVGVIPDDAPDIPDEE